MKVGGVLVCVTLLVTTTFAQTNLTVISSYKDLFVDRPPPLSAACQDGGVDNTARNAPVKMSSTASSTTAGFLATDDNLSLTKCAATRSSTNPYVRIDLQKTRQVFKIFLLLPSGIAMNGLQVYVGDDDTVVTRNKLCATAAKVASPWAILMCTPAINGRYVFLRLPGSVKTIKLCEINVYAQCPSLKACTNVAYRRPTRQSTTGHGGVSSRAVDGITSTSWGARSCTHTNGQTNPWWYVDLQDLRVVERVLVTNRGDCCWTRLNGMEVWVGINNKPPGITAPNKKCGTFATVPRAGTVTAFCPDNTVGQYVFVRVPGAGKVITVCEVQVYEPCPSQPLCLNPGCKRGAEANVARGRPTKHSSNYNSVFVSSKAVDGDFRTNINYCTHTATETDPWWYVDLGCERTVAKVTVTNRDSYGNRLDGFKVAVGNDVSTKGGNGNAPCGGGYKVAQGSTLMVECPRLVGRYVTVYLKGAGKILQLCEVQVFEPCDESCYNLALYQPSTKTGGAAYPDAATDGNPNTNYNGRSCYLSSIVNDPYFTLDLGHATKVGKVRLWNRGECARCPNGLDNFEIRVGMSTNGLSNPVCYYNNYQVASNQRYKVAKNQAVDVMCNANRIGRYVTVKQYGSRQLGICEIEVYATGNCYDSGCYNVARGKGAYISSLYATKWPANKAVDGNYWSKNINSGSCTHSNTQTNPWFRVDLWQEMIINKVYLANRGDCCGNRLTNVMVRIGNDYSNNGLKNPICRQGLRALGQGAYNYYACPNMRGRQITLQIVKTNAVLNFCEIQVCGTLAPNLALGKPTVQSSTGSNGPPNLGVDGDSNPTYTKGTCTHTTSEKNPWWRVDLQDEYLVTSIRITNRGDCCESRLWGIEIRIGNSLDFEGNNNAKCISKMWNVPKGATHTVMCNAGYGVKGRYVNLLIPGDNKILTFCELMVFGTRDKQCQRSGLKNDRCNQPCPAKTGGIGCHKCPAGQVGRLRHVESGLCAVPPGNKTHPGWNDLLVMTDQCDGIESLFLYSPSLLLYHVASGACVHVLYGGFSAIDGRPLVFWYGCDPNQNRLQYTIDDNHFKNVRTRQCIRVKAHDPAPGDTLNLYKDCTHGASDYEFVIDEESQKRWSIAINVATKNANTFGYFSDMWVNPKYFGNASNLAADAWLPAYDGVLVERIGIQINGYDRIVELPEDVRGKYTLQDLVLREGSISYLPSVQGQLDPFNFKLTSPPLAYCTNIGTNQQVLTNQQWHGCHSLVRIGVPMANAIRTGVIKLQMGDKCIHISGGGFGTPGDNTELVSWSGCTDDRLRFTYRADGSFVHSSGSKCLGLRDATPKKGTRVVIKPCSASTKFTWRSDGVIVMTSNTKLCWAVEGNSATPGNGKRIQLSDGCDPKTNAMFQFRMHSNVMESGCGKPTSAEGVGFYYGCGHQSGSAGRMNYGNLIFKQATVWVYGRLTCNPTTSSGCNARVGYCSCVNGYFGPACEYQCPDGQYGRNCRDSCQCMNGALCSSIDGKCTCKPGYRGRLCNALCQPGTYGDGCKKCNCSANAAGCNVFTGKCSCPAGYGGALCDQLCATGWWGPGCINKCTCVNGTCDSVTGRCTCNPGYTGSTCNNPCAVGLYGKDCVTPCHCNYKASCHHVTGACTCTPGYMGKDCSASCDSLHCGQGCNQLCQCAQGTCDRFTCDCKCKPGYKGVTCNQLCDSGMYGTDCAKKCLCHSQAKCDHVTGACTCSAGLTGTYCNETCSQGKWGANCLQQCDCAHGKCDPADGTCICESGYKGSKCDTQCSSGTFGADCLKPCNCATNVTASQICDGKTGQCLCKSNYYGVQCTSKCPPEKWGPNCVNNCPCVNSGTCDENDGSCQCTSGYIGKLCDRLCVNGKWGPGCQYSCTCHSVNGLCSQIDGSCQCKAGFHGHDCDIPCPVGTFGVDCKQGCTCFNGGCDSVTGQCQCDRGWTGTNCDQPCDSGTYGIGCSSQCQCDPTATCNPIDGSCTCAAGMQGKYCNHQCHGFYDHGCLARCPPCESGNVIVPKDCHPETGECQCKTGWTGVLCQDSCRVGYWGDGCQNQCLCKSGGICDHVTGNCSCPAGLTGALCELPCPEGWYGENCQFQCQCAHRQECDVKTGQCTCQTGYQGVLCSEACASDKWGQSCINDCDCKFGECNSITGFCSCDDGYQGLSCDTPCNQTTWGPNCINFCDCENELSCHPTDGLCVCPQGFTGDSCENSCELGFYGFRCESKCECVNGDCDHVSGSCNCTLGYTGEKCESNCTDNTYGYQCSMTCDCGEGEGCDPKTGCYVLSVTNDDQAVKADDGGLATSEIVTIVVSVVGGAVLVVVMVLVILYCKNRGDVNKALAAAYSAQASDVSFGPMDTVQREVGVRDGFDNPMYDNFKNDMYNDPVQENPTYAVEGDGMEEAIVADAADDYE